MQNYLAKIPTGVLATLNADGSPYAVPVHFVLSGEKAYIHTGLHGQKLEHIKRDSRVSFTAWEMLGYSKSDNPEPCRTGTNYRSIVVSGEARIIDDFDLKKSVLRLFAEKYTPEKNAGNIPDAAVDKTCVIEISGQATEKVKR
jgi:nitroimidazol reductase NimA-like FMN-containing flavoprotein (pyridoxamine 5'-phosphate oxidase superfamily)